MKEAIMKHLATCPNGCRQRMIADALGVWTANTELIKALHELERIGYIKSVPYRDNANMEYYNIWRLTTPAEKYEIIITKLERSVEMIDSILQSQERTTRIIDKIIDGLDKTVHIK